MTRTASIGVKCTSAQPGSLIVLVTRLFMCDKRFRYGPLHSNLHVTPAFATFCPIGELFSLSPLKVRSRSFSFSPFSFSLSLFLFFPREIHSILSRYHEVIILTAFVALLRFANLKITYIFFRFSVGLRFCYFWICKFYIAYYMLLEIKVEYLNGN